MGFGLPDHNAWRRQPKEDAPAAAAQQNLARRAFPGSAPAILLLRPSPESGAGTQAAYRSGGCVLVVLGFKV
ncbi:hypothetical protein CBR_g4592 [Chara braunii]|uniref:Uncharacterized protein n=1 Tax=Chara braunii TaxID=69332 RepID=A0A388KI82_CHABU|nr:hypothetical protein CBR_g4592 [Chara braunii]|eukprot:GBG69761.1 hypothetical protein CBR_g4592 [Chara braunii]